MITFNKKNISIDVSDQIVKFHGHIYRFDFYPHLNSIISVGGGGHFEKRQ